MLPLLTNIESEELIRATAIVAMAVTVLIMHILAPAGRA